MDDNAELLSGVKALTRLVGKMRVAIAVKVEQFGYKELLADVIQWVEIYIWTRESRNLESKSWDEDSIGQLRRGYKARNLVSMALQALVPASERPPRRSKEKGAGTSARPPRRPSHVAVTDSRTREGTADALVNQLGSEHALKALRSCVEIVGPDGMAAIMVNDYYKGTKGDDIKGDDMGVKELGERLGLPDDAVQSAIDLWTNHAATLRQRASRASRALRGAIRTLVLVACLGLLSALADGVDTDAVKRSHIDSEMVGSPNGEPVGLASRQNARADLESLLA